jgi:molybdenum cofactor cytidylyltransferase
MTPPRIGIIVLAAGASTRMGRPKQLLDLGGKSLVRRATETAIAAGGDPVIVVTGAAHDRVSADLCGLPIHICFNPEWERGMGTSIRRGIELLTRLAPKADAAIITLADQPDISADKLAKLVEAHHRTKSPLCAAAFGEAIGPPALFARAFFAELLAQPDQAGAKQLLLKHPAKLLRVDCPEAARDVDTPDDYEALHSASSS